MNALMLTNQLYDARKAARVVFHRQYDQQVALAIPELLRLMTRMGWTALQSALELAKECEAAGDPNMGLLFLAAAVELLEERPR